jgi:hypothetical protein
MKKIDSMIRNLHDFNLICEFGKVEYKVGKDKTGRKVTIDPKGKGLQFTPITVTFNQLVAHLERLAYKERAKNGDNQEAAKAIYSLFQLDFIGKVSLIKSKKQMNTCQKILLAIRRFFGNLRKPSHLEALRAMALAYLPSSNEPLGAEALKIKQDLETCLSKPEYRTATENLKTYMRMDFSSPKAAKARKEFFTTHLTNNPDVEALNKEMKPIVASVKKLHEEQPKQTRTLLNWLIKHYEVHAISVVLDLNDAQCKLDLLFKSPIYKILVNKDLKAQAKL